MIDLEVLCRIHALMSNGFAGLLHMQLRLAFCVRTDAMVPRIAFREVREEQMVRVALFRKSAGHARQRNADGRLTAHVGCLCSRLQNAKGPRPNPGAGHPHRRLRREVTD